MTVVEDTHWQPRRICCPVCGSGSARHIGYRGGWAHRRGAGTAAPIVRCRRCDLVYPNPMPFPRDLSHYDSPDEYFAAGDKVTSYVALLEEATRRRGGAGRMVDIGCGRGESLKAAAETGWTATGVDPSEVFVAEGRRRYGVDIMLGTIEDIDLPASGFDLVLLSAVLEHLYDPMSLLRHARRLLRGDGLLYVEVPNERSAYHRTARLYFRIMGRDWSPALSPTFPPYHVVGFSPRSLRVALEHAELRERSLRTYSINFTAVGGGARIRSAVARLLDRAAVRFDAAAGIVCWASPSHT